MGVKFLVKKQTPTMKEMYDSKLGAHKTVCIYTYYIAFIGGSLSLIPSIRSLFVDTFHHLWRYRLFRILIFHICFWILYNHIILFLNGLSRLMDAGITSRQKPTKRLQKHIYKPRPRRVPFNPTLPSSCPLLPPTEKNTLFVDLDQTLIFSFTSPPPTSQYSFMELIVLKFTNHIYYIVKRPGAEQLLRSAVASGFEIVIFTASCQGYASPILDWLDPNREFISHRLYRDSCTVDANHKYFKDIDVTGRRVDKSVVIDDDPSVYWKHYNNMICVKPFDGDLKDVELYKLLCFFELVGNFQDLRSAVKFYYSVDFYYGGNPPPRSNYVV